MSPCECKKAGWCPVHQRDMNSRQHEWCSTDPGYYFAYQKERHERQGKPFKPAVPVHGVGSEIVRILQWVGIKSEGCECPIRAIILNSFGPAECWKRRKQIVDWLQEEVDQRSHLKWWFCRWMGYGLILYGLAAHQITRKTGPS